MLGSHAAFRRDLARLAKVAAQPGAAEPERALAVANGWTTFKRQLLNHHEVEDEVIWPLLRERLTGRPDALSVLDEMEHEHSFIEPLLAAADAALVATNGGPTLADVVDEMHGKLIAHLAHEERDALPLIVETVPAPEWAQVQASMMDRPGALDIGGEMFAWILDGGSEDEVAAWLGAMPQFIGQQYRGLWKPEYDAVARW